MTSFRPRNLSECMGALWCRKWMVLGLTAIVLCSAYLVIRRVPSIYESRSVVVVADGENEGLVTTGQIAAVTEQLTSRATLEPIIQKHGLYRTILDHAGMDVAVDHMRKAIAVDTKVRRDIPESLTITYKYTEPETTRAVLDELVAKFAMANDDIRRQAEDEIASLNGQISAIDSQLDGLDHERAASARANAASRREFETMQAVRATREAANSTIETLTSHQQSLVARVAGLKQQVKDQEALVAALPAPAVEASGAAGPLFVRRAELNAQLAEYAKLYTEKNPKVVTARTQLAAVDRQIAQLGGADATDADRKAASPEAAELRGLKRDLAQLQTELDITNKEIARRQQAAPQMPTETALAASAAEPLAPEADGGYDRLRVKYQALMNRQDALQRALPAALVGQGVFRVVDPPSHPETPVGPNKAFLALFALGLALGLALLVAAALEARRIFRIQDDLDVSYFLGAPVLAAIPETLTPVESHARRTSAVVRGLALAALAVIAVPAFVALLSALHVFELLAER